MAAFACSSKSNITVYARGFGFVGLAPSFQCQLHMPKVQQQFRSHFFEAKLLANQNNEGIIIFQGKMKTGCTPMYTKTLINFGPLNQFLRLLSYFVEKCSRYIKIIFRIFLRVYITKIFCVI